MVTLRSGGRGFPADAAAICRRALCWGETAVSAAMRGVCTCRTFRRTSIWSPCRCLVERHIAQATAYEAQRAAGRQHLAPAPLSERQACLSVAWCGRRGSACEPVSEVKQVGQVQYSPVEARERDMERLAPVGGDGVQPVVGAREAAGDGGDCVRVTAEVDRRA